MKETSAGDSASLICVITSGADKMSPESGRFIKPNPLRWEDGMTASDSSDPIAGVTFPVTIPCRVMKPT